MKFSLSGLLFFTLLQTAWAKEPNLRENFYFSVKGSTPLGNVSEAVTFLPDGTAELVSLAPLIPDEKLPAPRVGSFRGAMPRSLLQEAIKLSERTRKNVKPNEPPLADLLIYQLGQKVPLRWTQADSATFARLWEAWYSTAKASLLPHPKSAAELYCHRGKRSGCALKNLGKEPLVVVNPLHVEGSLMCVSEKGARHLLRSTNETQSKKAVLVPLKPEERLIFSLEFPSDCARLHVQTLKLKAEKGYEKALVGDFFVEVLP